MFAFLKKKEPRRVKGLGRDEKKHIHCKYKNKKKCPDDCKECCFSIKLKGDFMVQVQAWDSAAELYEEAVLREPDYADAWLALADVSTRRGDHGRALEAYDEALALDPRFGEALYGRAAALKNLHRLEEALTAADDVLALYEYGPCHDLKLEIRRLMAEDEEKEAQKLEEKNRLLKKMMRAAAQKGYIADRLPTVPELTALAETFIPECFVRLTGRKKYTLEAVKSAAVCCFYGGMGIARLWKAGWRDFTASGIDRGLFAPRGFACMDEYTCELLGIPFESEDGQSLRKFAGELSGIAMGAIMNQVGAVRMDDRQMEMLLRDSMRDVYILGVGIALL